MPLTPKENLLRVIHHDNPEWVPYGMESEIMIGPPVVERPSEAGLDSWGVKWNLEEGAHGGTHPAHESYVITDLSRWREQVDIPDVDAMDWQQVHRDDINRDEHIVTAFIEFGLFERSYLLLGMDNALMAYMTETELMGELAGAIADYKIRVIERFDDEIDLDVVWLGDDWGTQQNLFMPPDIWRATIGKHTKRIYDRMKARDIIINQHSCGKIEKLFGDMVEMGADMWNPCQPCNDLAALKKQFGGGITFCGGIDSQFVLDRPGVTPEEVRTEVRRRIDEMAEGGGYVAAPSHGVPYRQEIVDAMVDEIATYGRQLYQAG